MCSDIIADKLILNKLMELAQTPFEKLIVAEYLACMANIELDEERKKAANDALLQQE